MADPPESDESLRGRRDRYQDASLIGKAALRLAGAAPSTAERESLRRRELGAEGRIAEDAVRAVRASTPIWSLLAEKGIHEDLTRAELDAIAEDLLGRPVQGWEDVARIDVSVKFTDAERIALLHRVIPGDLHPEVFNAYRYATLTPGSMGTPEPFVMALSDDESGVNEVVGAMLVAGTFLRHEQEFGELDAADVAPLETMLQADLDDVRQTVLSLRDA